MAPRVWERWRGQKPKMDLGWRNKTLDCDPMEVLGSVTSPHCPSLPHPLKSRHPQARCWPQDKALGEQNLVQRTGGGGGGTRGASLGMAPAAPQGKCQALLGWGSSTEGRNQGVLPWQESTGVLNIPPQTPLVKEFASVRFPQQHHGTAKGQSLGVNRLGLGHGHQNTSRAEPNTGKRCGLAGQNPTKSL